MADIPSSLKQWLLALPFLGPVLRILAAIKNSNNTLKRTLELEQRFEQLNNNFTERQLDFKLNIARALARKQNIDSTHIALSKQQPLDNDLNDLYIAFENQFRGTADEIKQQQVKYLPFLSAIAQNISEPLKVLDIGCGRGEWLRLLSEHNYESEGVDLSHTMVDLCLLEGFKATQGDAIAYLENQDDNSVHVITAFHVVEHLPFEHMVSLFDQCLRVLKPGGKIIFETPNPENLTVGGYSFYLDPTHKNPIPPITLEFIARQRGYSQINIYRYNPRKEVGDVTPLVENWFNSPVDFAVIAEK
jgi:O-antigen chain-terminating methyltransferase